MGSSSSTVVKVVSISASTLSEEETRDQLNAEVQAHEKLFRETPGVWQEVLQDVPEASERLEQHMEQVLASLYVYKQQKYSFTVRREYEVIVSERLVQSGSVPVFCDIVVNCVREELRPEYFWHALNMLVNFSNRSPEMCRAIQEHGQLLPTVVAHLDKLFHPDSDGKLEILEEDLARWCLLLLKNIAAVDGCEDLVRHITNVFQVVSKYLAATGILKILAVGLLAIIATDEEAEAMAITSDVVQVVLKGLKDAMDSDTHHTTVGNVRRYVTDWLVDVKHLSRNDANSRRLVKKGVLTLLIRGLRSHDKSERIGCINAMWWLSFNEDNHKKMMNESDLLDLVMKLHCTTSDPCYRAAEGVLFQLKESLGRSQVPSLRSLAAKLHVNSKSHSTTSPHHVMLSYQSDHRDVVRKIAEYLKEKGVPVWMDIYNMAEGDESTSQTMAEAVENAVVFLMCVSDQYKNSPYCRGEAEYAFKRQKHIIPLRMEKGYNPDGWLGFIEGNKYFYDFTKEDTRQHKMEQLLKAMQRHWEKTAEEVGEKTTQPVKLQQSKTETSHGDATLSSKDVLMWVRTWTPDMAVKWREKFDLNGEKTKTLSGTEVALFLQMQSSAPETFFNVMASHLGNDLSEMAKLTIALDGIPSMLTE